MYKFAWILDLLLGKRVYRRWPVSRKKTMLPFADGDVPATIEVDWIVLGRSRWFPVREHRISVIPDNPIAIPGQDFVYSISYPGDDEGLAIKRFVERIEKDLEQAREKA